MHIKSKIISIDFRDNNPESFIELSKKRIQEADAESWERDIHHFIIDWFSGKDHITVHTSGSTGDPKPISLKKNWMVQSARQTCDFFNLGESSKALLCLPAGYIAGKMMIVRAIISGLELFAVEPTGNPFKSIKQHIDFAAVTPFQLFQSQNILKNNPIVHTLIVGGGEISSSLQKDVQDLPTRIFATYGMTETSSHIALRRVNGEDKEDFFSVLGKTEIGQDNRNCLTIKNPDLFDGTLITNDVVEIHDKSYFRWMGRYDNIINSGGIKVVPELIEQLIAPLRSERILISSKKDSLLGEAIVLVIETPQLSTQEIMHLKNEIKTAMDSSYTLPRQIIAVYPFPETPTGKINRTLLKQMINSSPTSI
jgi:o-succinylbenzoate---CoA ligase